MTWDTAECTWDAAPNAWDNTDGPCGTPTPPTAEIIGRIVESPGYTGAADSPAYSGSVGND